MNIRTHTNLKSISKLCYPKINQTFKTLHPITSTKISVSILEYSIAFFIFLSFREIISNLSSPIEYGVSA